MADTSKLTPVSDRDVFYYRQRSKNRLFEALTSFFAGEAERRGISKRDIAECLRRDPASITRWLTTPSNLTLDTISDLLLSLGAEMDYFVAKFEDRATPNYTHPLLARLNVTQHVEYSQPQKPSNPYQPLTPLKSNTRIIEATQV
jgi:transcriptional regulator with XRE-family HTH domain